MSKKQLLLLTLSLGFMSLNAGGDDASATPEQEKTPEAKSEFFSITTLQNHPNLTIAGGSLVLGAAAAAVDCVANSSDEEVDADSTTRSVVTGLVAAGTAVTSGLLVKNYLNADVSALEKANNALLEQNNAENKAELEKLTAELEKTNKDLLEKNNSENKAKLEKLTAELEKARVKAKSGNENAFDQVRNQINDLSRESRSIERMLKPSFDVADSIGYLEREISNIEKVLKRNIKLKPEEIKDYENDLRINVEALNDYKSLKNLNGNELFSRFQSNCNNINYLIKKAYASGFEPRFYQGR